MKRRDLLGALAVGGALAVTGCSKEQKSEGAAAVNTGQTFKWSMATTWPKDFQGVGTGANYFAKLVNDMSAGRLQIKVYGAGEIVPALEVFDAVSQGTVEIGHGASYYWKGKMPVAPLFSAIPFGMTATEINGWLYHGGGMALYRELYAPFNVIPTVGGNTGCQMAGWFKRDINSLTDIKGLKMRIPGLGGEVLARAGGEPVLIPGGEVFTALQTGAIDAAEWIGPYNDLAFGLYKAAQNYYYPGWHEPGTALEIIINKQRFEALPAGLQTIVMTAAQAANIDMLSEFTARNHEALRSLITDHQVQVKRLPDDVLAELKKHGDAIVRESASADQISQRILESCTGFLASVKDWSKIADLSYMQTR